MIDRPSTCFFGLPAALDWAEKQGVPSRITSAVAQGVVDRKMADPARITCGVDHCWGADADEHGPAIDPFSYVWMQLAWNDDKVFSVQMMIEAA